MEIPVEKTFIVTHIAGLQFYPGKEIYNDLKPGSSLHFILEPCNAHDKFAVEVYYAPSSIKPFVKLGYIPAQYSRIVHVLMLNKIHFYCLIDSVDKRKVTITLNLT